MAFVSFSEMNLFKIRQLKEAYSDKEEVRGFISSGREVIIILMERSNEELADLVFQVMKKAQAMPTVNIMTPNVVKLDLRIPDSILDSIYKDLQTNRK